MARSRVFTIAFAAAGLLALSPPPAQAFYTGFNIFGDSLSDLGNLYASTAKLVPASPPYDNGRFSNGPIWVEDLAQTLKITAPTASLAGGSDYAFGTATASPAVPGATPVPTAVEQVAMFLALHPGGADPGALYSMWIGSNDVLDVLDDKLTTALAEPLLKMSAQLETQAITMLVNAGAKEILVGLVPDISATPSYNDAANPEHGEAKTLSEYYNQQLAADILADASRADIHEFDPFKLLDEVTTNKAEAAKYNLTDVTDPCYDGPYFGGGSVCSDPSKYLFWDHVHPTEVGHTAVADLAYAALNAGPIAPVPLPAAAPMFGASLLLVGVVGYGLTLRRGGGQNGRA